MVFDYDSLIFSTKKKKICHFRLQILAWLTDDEFIQFSYFNFVFLQFGSCNDDLDDEENWFFMLIFVSVYILCFDETTLPFDFCDQSLVVSFSGCFHNYGFQKKEMK